jgi:DNA-binding transcriptional MerR regulator
MQRRARTYNRQGMARANASEEKLYKIGEVCRMADVQPYVLRYWETEFPQLAPGKSGGGQRLYNRREIDVILRIKELLYRDGFTIAGAKKKLEQEQSEPIAATTASAQVEPASDSPSRNELTAMLTRTREELLAILRMLD